MLPIGMFSSSTHLDLQRSGILAISEAVGEAGGGVVAGSALSFLATEMDHSMLRPGMVTLGSAEK